jgi:hypothetical protein
MKLARSKKSFLPYSGYWNVLKPNSQTVVQVPVALTSTRSLLEMWNFKTHPRPMNSERTFQQDLQVVCGFYINSRKYYSKIHSMLSRFIIFPPECFRITMSHKSKVSPSWGDFIWDYIDGMFYTQRIKP